MRATRADLRALAAELGARGALGPGVTEQPAVDTDYALATNESIFLRLTRECGWPPERYAGLIAGTLKAVLGRSPQARGPRPGEFGRHSRLPFKARVGHSWEGSTTRQMRVRFPSSHPARSAVM